MASRAARAFWAFLAPSSSVGKDWGGDWVWVASGQASISTASARVKTLRMNLLLLTPICQPNRPASPIRLPGQDRAAIHVENFAGDESGQRRAEKQYRSGNLASARRATHGNARGDLRPHFGVVQRGRRHFGSDPAGSDAVDANAPGRQF